MPIEQRDELCGIIQQSLARAEGDYASVGQLPAKRINLTNEESVDYLAGFNFRMGVRERAAIEEFQELLLEIEKLEHVYHHPRLPL
jgi:predicted solute-binding protein